MIEAVNSSIANAAVLRGNAEQLSAPARTDVAPVSENEPVSPQLAPYVSPYISVDRDRGAVIQIRDSDTGDVLKEFPSEVTSRLRTEQQEYLTAERDVPTTSSTTASSESATSGLQTITVAQSAPPAQAQGPGLAQAAIAALSTGAQSGQGAPTANVQVSA